ncbi:hypothetical protein HNR23_000782 [Nocardiopsis mwathae]|uniref:Uncharacterized protein n=1 Tax=Nocardiopsis mwathae TaxID=1472723 RepID=A0A7W9YEP1_9ACTN|nr:hypothetical protein [Nocardiopsis mwathae]MBB6170722.1 hypothetical protein [Nocardiopsis mwathae]
MPTDPPIHPAVSMTNPAGETVRIDVAMAPVISELWRLQFETVACCQNVGEATAGVRSRTGPVRKYQDKYGDRFIAYHAGYALVKMPTNDACRLADLLLPTSFQDRLRRRWRPDSWRMHVPLICDDGASGPSRYALLHFPDKQIPELTNTLKGIDLS